MAEMVEKINTRPRAFYFSAYKEMCFRTYLCLDLDST